MDRKRINVQRLGFTLLHPPDDSLSQPHTVNIVFIHGLRGHPLSTWEYDVPPSKHPHTSTPSHSSTLYRSLLNMLQRSRVTRDEPESQLDLHDPDSAVDVQNVGCWPADVLPGNVPHARIWTYGYNADVVAGFFGKANSNSIIAHAHDLMVKLERERRLRDGKPIIFVAHSLGGLVLKRALAEMDINIHTRYARLLDRVIALVFCGCPHRGADAAAWASLISKLISVAFVDSASNLLSNLEINSEILDMIQDDFLRVLANRASRGSEIAIHSFLEGRVMTGIKGLNTKIVDNFSSKLGYATEICETIDADHRNMVKEAGRRDISSVLEDFEKQHGISEAVQPDKDTMTSYKYLHVLFVVDHRTILAQIPSRFPNTCEWILESDTWKSWYSREGSNILWLSAFPGRGKSVLAKYLLEEALGPIYASPGQELRSEDDHLVISFFCSYRDSQTRTLRSLLCSLLYQLCFQRPKLQKHIGQNDENAARCLASSVGDLWIILSRVIEHFIFRHALPMSRKDSRAQIPMKIPVNNLYIVVDALDELEKADWVACCQGFSELCRRTGNNLRLIVTSRREAEIEKAFTNTWHLELGASNHITSDVDLYIESVVTEYGTENNFSKKMVQTIIKQLVERADGMFLWANLAWSFFIDGVGTWRKAIFQERLSFLQHLPPGMEGLYSRILARINPRIYGELSKAFEWIVAARRAMTSRELATALALRTRPLCMADVDIPLNMEAFLKRTCPQLLKIEKGGLITFVHKSFKDFLLEVAVYDEGTTQVPNPFFIDLQSVNLEIGLDCLSYLGLSDFSHKNLDEARRYELFNYAHLYWLDHLAGRNDQVLAIWPLLQRMIDKKTYLFRWFDTTEMTFTLWDQGFFDLFRDLARFGVNLDISRPTGDHLIHSVVARVDEIPFQLLRDLQLEINGRSRLNQTLLHRCVVAYCDKTIALLDSIQDWVSSGSTYLGIYQNWLHKMEEDIYQLLSFPGIDMSLVDNDGHTPLNIAIHQGLEKLVSMFMGHKSLNSRAKSSALFVAARQGLVPILEDLLDQGVNISAKTKYGETALHLAASNGHQRILARLASKSPEYVLNAKDRYGWTIAHHAVTSGNNELVVWLLQQPDVNFGLKDGHGRRAVAFAAAYGTDRMLEAILDNRPGDASHSDLFENTLFHMAALGNNRQNLIFLHRLYEKGALSWPKRNKWGKTVLDLVNDPDTQQYLQQFGFQSQDQLAKLIFPMESVHSSPLVTDDTSLGNKLVLMIIKGGPDDESDDESNDEPDDEHKTTYTKRKREEYDTGRDDQLGKRFNSIYALD